MAKANVAGLLVLLLFPSAHAICQDDGIDSIPPEATKEVAAGLDQRMSWEGTPDADQLLDRLQITERKLQGVVKQISESPKDEVAIQRFEELVIEDIRLRQQMRLAEIADQRRRLDIIEKRIHRQNANPVAMKQARTRELLTSAGFQSNPLLTQKGNLVGRSATSVDLRVREVAAEYNRLIQEEDLDGAEELVANAIRELGDVPPLNRILLKIINAKRRVEGVKSDESKADMSSNHLVSYKVDDLPLWSRDGKTQHVDLLVQLISTKVEPDSWKKAASTISYDKRKSRLIVLTSGENHAAIVTILEGLRSS